MTETPGAPAAWWKRLAWLILLWTSGVATLATIAWILRWFMQLAGLTGQ
jgi:hypothetical protein